MRLGRGKRPSESKEEKNSQDEILGFVLHGRKSYATRMMGFFEIPKQVESFKRQTNVNLLIRYCFGVATEK